jgi:hypothetical protein
MKKGFFLTLGTILFLSEICLAQGVSQTKTVSSWRKNTAIVLFSGIGGSLLGLSTLSFYGNPQEHTGNINTGTILGILAGIGYVVYDNTAKRPAPRTYDYYGMFPTNDVVKPATVATVPSVQVEFTF